MNILIVGNGFDLSHYLPTKYDHFMVAMQAIENWDDSKGEMGFDDLFGSLYEKEDYFFGYTKAMYKIDEIKISTEQIEELKNQLAENVWYQYFSDHVKEVKTWIDFELKIEQALEVVCNFMEEIELHLEKNNSLDNILSLLKKREGKEYYLSQKNIRILDLLKILDVEYRFVDTTYGGKIVDYNSSWNKSFENNSENFIKKFKGYDEYLYKDVTSFLNKSLLDFGIIFTNYLNIINNFKNINENLYVPILDNINQVYSFNYTSTFSRLYKSNIDSYFLHGKIGDQNEIVLGVSDLNIQFLRKFDLWGFTKYCQKLILNTDYNFIEEFLIANEKVQQEVELTKDFWLNRSANGTGSVKLIGQKIQKVLEDNSLNLIFFVWGHSLDYSDNIYIKELFSFNEPYDQNVRIVIYYFNKQANFDLLANLIHILGKEKVEKWMKKEWLKFEKNPNIAEINGIKPVELLKTEVA